MNAVAADTRITTKAIFPNIAIDQARVAVKKTQYHWRHAASDYYKYKYAPLESIQEARKEVLLI